MIGGLPPVNLYETRQRSTTINVPRQRSATNKTSKNII